MNKTFTLIITIGALLFANRLKAQTPSPAMPFGKVDMADLQLKQCDFEKDANAMVLFDKADVYFDNDFNIVMERHKRIKIFNDKGKSEGNVRIEYYSANHAEYITDVQVETINETNGKPEITKLEKKLIYLENVDKGRLAYVFAFPNVKAGSIIEYKYKWQTVSWSNFPDWYFQSNLPSRYSEISTEIPDYFYYSTQHRIHQPLVKNAHSTNSKSIGAGADATTYNTDKYIRALSAVPSLSDEPFMRSRLDNLQCILFQLTSVRPTGGFVQTRNDDTWPKVGGALAEDDDFGKQLNKKLKNEDLIIAKAKTLKNDDEKIAYIFKEVRDRMKWNESDRYYTNDGVSSAWDKQTGNSAEINIALYHLLKQAQIRAYPMIVSTREHGRVNIAYPSLYQFNRTVAYVPIDSTKQYVLDASGKYNTYNDVPDGLLNSWGVYVGKEEKMCKTIFLERAMPARQVVSVTANISGDGKLDGSAEISSFSYYKQRSVERYKKDGEEKYKKFLKDDDNNLDISSLKLENMDVDTLPLTQKIAFKLTLAGSDENYIYINPNLFTSMKSNPFINEKRTTDIDFAYRNSYMLSGNYKIPAGFKTDAIPKNISMTMPDKSISFRRIAVEEDGAVKVNYMINYRKTIFFKEDYPNLHEFFKKMHEMLNEQIVLKKA